MISGVFKARYMLDIKEVRKNPSEVERKLKTKDPQIELKPLLDMDERLRSLKTEVEELKAKRNAVSKELGLKKQKGEDIAPFTASMAELAEIIARREITRSYYAKECCGVLGKSKKREEEATRSWPPLGIPR